MIAQSGICIECPEGCGPPTEPISTGGDDSRNGAPPKCGRFAECESQYNIDGYCCVGCTGISGITISNTISCSCTGCNVVDPTTEPTSTSSSAVTVNTADSDTSTATRKSGMSRTAPPDRDGTSNRSLGPGAIAGITVAVLLVLTAAAVAVVIALRKREVGGGRAPASINSAYDSFENASSGPVQDPDVQVPDSVEAAVEA